MKFLGLEVGSWADWASGIGSLLAIIFVIIQMKFDKKNMYQMKKKEQLNAIFQNTTNAQRLLIEFSAKLEEAEEESKKMNNGALEEYRNSQTYKSGLILMNESISNLQASFTNLIDKKVSIEFYKLLAPLTDDLGILIYYKDKPTDIDDIKRYMLRANHILSAISTKTLNQLQINT